MRGLTRRAHLRRRRSSKRHQIRQRKLLFSNTIGLDEFSSLFSCRPFLHKKMVWSTSKTGWSRSLNLLRKRSDPILDAPAETRSLGPTSKTSTKWLNAAGFKLRLLCQEMASMQIRLAFKASTARVDKPYFWVWPMVIHLQAIYHKMGHSQRLGRPSQVDYENVYLSSVSKEVWRYLEGNVLPWVVAHL